MKAASVDSPLRRVGVALSPVSRITAAFFLHAVAMGGLFPRLPEIQRGLGVAEGRFGLALIGAASGALLALTLAGGPLERIGHRRALLALLGLLPVFEALASRAGGPLAFFLLLFPAGLCLGALEIILNLEADRVEYQTGTRFMNRAHGFWSIGFFVTGLTGAGLSQLGVSPQWHLALVVPVEWLGIALLLGRFDAAPPRHAGRTAPAARFARPTRGVMWLVVLALSPLVLEGAGADWSAIYMRDVFGAAPFTAGAAVATGALAQAIARLFADRFVARHSRVAVARVLLGVLGAGALLVFAAPAGWIALIGFAAMGVGTSAIFPLAMSAAAQRTDRAPATNVAALAQFSFVAFLLGPPLLGLVAETFGIRWIFGAGLPLVGLSLIAAGALATR